MQQHVKRMQGHFQDVKKLFKLGKKSDSFATHFAASIPEETELSWVKCKVNKFVKIKVDILWKGDPLTCIKTFGTRSCKLCNKERMALLKLTRSNPNKVINKCNKIYGTCHHKMRFHWFTKAPPATGTDESDKDERVSSPSSTTYKVDNWLQDADFFPHCPATRPYFSNQEDNREAELIPADINQGFGFLTNRLEGYRACFRIGLERNDPFDDDLIDTNLLHEPPEGEIPLGGLAINV
jgi:hypothetical protein